MAEGKSNLQELSKGLWRENPVFVQLLGLCPSLAVTNSVINAIAMGAATTFVLVGSSALVSSLRNFIPKQVRITTFIVIIATFVTVADFTLQAIAPAVHKELGAFIALIVVNCIILGRQEAFASKNTIGASMADALGMSMGFTLALLMLGSIREVLGSGSFLGIQLFGDSFEPWSVMVLPPGGFLTIGVLLMIFAAMAERKKRNQARLAAAVQAAEGAAS